MLMDPASSTEAAAKVRRKPNRAVVSSDQLIKDTDQDAADIHVWVFSIGKQVYNSLVLGVELCSTVCIHFEAVLSAAHRKSLLLLLFLSLLKSCQAGVFSNHLQNQQNVAS
jgi:hypothetical protein